MFIDFAVITAFSTLFIASIFDVKSKKGDVPELILFTGIGAGLLLHISHSLNVWSHEAITSSIITGLLFGLYGFFAYKRGMWGGADFLGLVILGVSTPYFLGLMGVFNLVVNVMMVGFLYAVIFGLYKGLRSDDVISDFVEQLRSKRKYVYLGIIFGAFFAVIAQMQGLNGILYFIAFSFMTLLYFFMVSVEEKMMVKTVDASEVEEGDVLAEGEIKGVTEEELEDLEGEVEIKSGIRFMPVFPVGLAITVAGVSFLELMVLAF